jgi:hypothetical protein
MDSMARRTFCGTALMTLPLLKLSAGARSVREDSPSPIIDGLADEVSRITAEGARNGFRGEHFRRYAGVMRTLDAVLEDKGINREVDKHLDADDYNKLDPARAAHIVVDYWNKHGISFNEGDLATSLAIDATSYREIKKAIKRQGGIRPLHGYAADAFDRKAKEYGTVSFKGGPLFRDNRLVLPHPREAEFIPAQWEFVGLTFGADVNCLCKAMLTEGYILIILGFFSGGVLDTIGSLLIAIANLMMIFGVCNPAMC